MRVRLKSRSTCFAFGHAATILASSIFVLIPHSSKASASGQAVASSTVSVAAGVSGLTATAWQSVDATTQNQINDWMQNSAYGLTPNLGQVANHEGNTADEVLFTANVAGAEVFVTKTGLSHYFLKQIKKGPKRWYPKGARASEKEYEWRRIDVDLLGASISAERVRTAEPLTDLGVTHFYRGHSAEGVLNVESYGKVTFADVYPGIDWAVISRPNEAVQHDFVVKPGADISRIRLEYRGASAIEVSDDHRRLRIRTELGEVQEGALRCFQSNDGALVAGRFAVEGNIVTFDIGDYDRSQSLIIDPPLVWSTYYGSTNHDGPRSILCDNVNNVVYVVGYSFSNNMPTQNAGGGAFFQGTMAGNSLLDGVIWKFTQSGVRIWVTYYGGSGDEQHSDLALDQFQNLYICGYTASADWPKQFMPGAYNDTTYNSGQTDATILKFNSNGVRQWASFYGGSFYDYAQSIVVDASGAIFMTGYTTSSDFPIACPGGAYCQSSIAPFEDVFVVKFSPTGSLVWSTYLGGPGNEESFGIGVSPNAIYVTGMTQSSAFPFYYPGGATYIDSTLDGSQDGFIAKFSLGGAQLWASYLGGDSTDWADDAVIDGNGNVFVAGYSESTNFPVINPGGAYTQSWAGALDMTLNKFNSADSMIWSTYYGGSDIDFLLGAKGKSICLDPQGRFYVTGMTGSANFPVVNPGGSFFWGTQLSDRDATIGQFTNGGAMLWSTYFGSNNPDFGSSICIGNSGCIFATGEAVDSGSFFGVNPGGGAYYQPFGAGLDDGYFTKFCAATGACCIDFTCVGANSAAECSTLGGQTFYPNQPCSTTVCSILCNICGKKWNDLDKDGTQDAGEPPLVGWTIQLYYWNGPFYASAITDSAGNYCFNDIPCGSWTVTEQLQPNWVQTYPSPNVHNLTMGTGQSLNNINFGNSSCIADTCCVQPAAGMIAWYPFDESVPGIANDIAAKTRNGWHYYDQLGHAPGVVDGAISLDGSRYVRVFEDPFAQVDTGSFSIDLWIKPTSFAADCATSPLTPCTAIPILDNRNDLDGAAGNNGIMLYIKRVSATQAKLGLAMNVFPNPTDSFESPAAPITLNQWQHVAVTVDRSSGAPLGTFYYNGGAVGTFAPRSGRIYSTNGVGSVLDIGHGPTSSSFGPGLTCNTQERKFIGLLDELEIWIRPLPAVEIGKLYAAGSKGKCKITCAIPSSVVLCKTATTVTMNLTVCNRTASASAARYSFAPIATGAGCNFNANGITFSPASGVLNLLPGQCTQVTVTLSRPFGFVPGNVACFCVTVQDTLTKATSTCCSKLIASDQLCVKKVDPIDIEHALTGVARPFGFTVGNDTDSLATLNYTLRGESTAGDAMDPPAISLNGLPPGTPVIGSIMLPPWSEATIAGDAIITEYRPMDLTSVVLEADADGDGQADPLGSALFEPVSYADCNANSVDDAQDILLGTSNDANGNGFPDECEVPPSSAASCFLCGDADGNGAVSIADAVFLINYIFAGGPAPNPLAAGDADCSSSISIADAVFLINYIFGGGAPPCAACP